MGESTPLQILDEETVAILRCPVTGSRLRVEEGFLVSEVGSLRYPVREGIPALLAEEAKLPAEFPTLDAFKQHYRDQITRAM